MSNVSVLDQRTSPPRLVYWMLRVAGYTALVAGAALMPWLDIGNAVRGQLFTEHTILEGMQLVAMAVPTIALVVFAAIQSSTRTLSATLALLLVCATIRELDLFFDTYVFDGAWQLLLSATLALGATLVWRDWQRFRNQAWALASTAAMGLLAAGTLTTTVFSRLFGMSEFWLAVMQERYDRSVKNAVEETVELYGYTLIMIGIIEYGVWLRSRRKG
ncbi:MAG: hypothetical protein R3200_11110 [Xanthomonadales bacterium]|nr:hypothetical protein [Xanthomonadales bacterium]